MSKKLTYCVYVHTNKINGKKYIGITCQKPEARWGVEGSRYLYEDDRTRSAFAEAIRKYDWENFTHEILFEGLTEVDAKAKEKELIAYYRTYIGFEDCKGYNMTLGGDGAALYETEEERRAAIRSSRQKHYMKAKQDPVRVEKQRKASREASRKKRQDVAFRETQNSYTLDYYYEHKEQLLPRIRQQSQEYYNTHIKNNQEAKDARNAQRNERRKKIKEIRDQLKQYIKINPELFTDKELQLVLEKYPNSNSYKCENLPKLSKLFEKIQKLIV